MKKCCGNCKYFSKWNTKPGKTGDGNCNYNIKIPESIEYARYVVNCLSGIGCHCFEEKK